MLKRHAARVVGLMVVALAFVPAVVVAGPIGIGGGGGIGGNNTLNLHVTVTPTVDIENLYFIFSRDNGNDFSAVTPEGNFVAANQSYGFDFGIPVSLLGGGGGPIGNPADLKFGLVATYANGTGLFTALDPTVAADALANNRTWDDLYGPFYSQLPTAYPHNPPLQAFQESDLIGAVTGTGTYGSLLFQGGTNQNILDFLYQGVNNNLLTDFTNGPVTATAVLFSSAQPGGSVELTFSQVPEPSSVVLTSLGFLAYGVARRRRARA